MAASGGVRKFGRRSRSARQARGVRLVCPARQRRGGMVRTCCRRYCTRMGSGRGQGAPRPSSLADSRAISLNASVASCCRTHSWQFTQAVNFERQREGRHDLTTSSRTGARRSERKVEAAVAALCGGCWFMGSRPSIAQLQHSLGCPEPLYYQGASHRSSRDRGNVLSDFKACLQAALVALGREAISKLLRCRA